jgi:tetratricopeptide repeat protein 30
MLPIKTIPEGQRTKVIYTLIKEERYTEAIQHLTYEL